MPDDLVLQSAGEGRYAGPLLYGRYQVLQDRDGYHLVDLVTMFSNKYLSDWTSLQRHPSRGDSRGDPILFSHVEDAETYALHLARKDHKMNDQSLQSAGEGRYTGPLLHDRYQVLESRAIKGSYFLADIQAQTAVRATSHKAVGDILRFDSIDEAEAYAAELVGQKLPQPVAKKTGKTIAAMNPRAQTASKDTAAAMFRRLILEAKLTDDEIFKEVQKAFGLADNRRSYVDWYRKELKKKGQIA